MLPPPGWAEERLEKRKKKVEEITSNKEEITTNKEDNASSSMNVDQVQSIGEVQDDQEET